jgi:transposase InsO family protein
MAKQWCWQWWICFFKYAHFLPLSHPYTATMVARVFFDNVVKSHGISDFIVSDRGPVFTSKFWSELFALTGVKLQLSSAFHLQSDGQSEAVNKVITMYLRGLAGDRPRQWLQWLLWAEYCYNTGFHSSLKTMPFKVVYGRDPPSLRSYGHGNTQLRAVHHQLQERDEFLKEVRDRLEQAQTRYKLHYDRHHREQEFQVDEWAWLRLLHRPIASLQVVGRGKLGPKYFGPFQVIEKLDTVAY